jgi:hypothetical protein
MAMLRKLVTRSPSDNRAAKFPFGERTAITIMTTVQKIKVLSLLSLSQNNALISSDRK